MTDLEEDNNSKLIRIETIPIELAIQNEITNFTEIKPETESSITISSSQEVQLTRYSYLNPLYWLYTTNNTIEQIESNMLKLVKIPLKRYFVNIRNDSLKIWTMSANTESKKTPLVLVHGFCGGLAMWVPNIDSLSESRPFYAFDLLGFGRSSRPNFSTDPIVAETQFIESIEDWRKEMNIDQMILLGHSFGGYLVTSYTIKYPDRVRALILADPWGFPEKPTSKPDTPMPLWIKVIAKASQYVGPLGILRVTGHVGLRLFKHLRPDFGRKYTTWLEDPNEIYSYLYHANNFHPSGEAGFRAIAEYFGFAKNPMIRRIDKVSDDIPIWFIYGSRSWIDNASGFSSIAIRQNSVSTSVKLITGAGHHVYADKPNEFNEYVKYIFEQIDEYDLRQSEEMQNNTNFVLN